MRSIFVLLIVLTLAPTTQAQLRLPSIFSDHMVLQRDKPVRVWGWADNGAEVIVRYGEQTLRTTTDSEGHWEVELAAMPADVQGSDLTIQSDDATRLVFEDVVVGEVWICGGQSNMEWPLRASRDADVEIDSAVDPAIRFIKLPHVARMTRQEDFPRTRALGRWSLATADEVGSCSAVAYYFGRRLRRRLDVPVGLIDTSWGGTMAQHWASKPTLRQFPEVVRYFSDHEAAVQAFVDGGGEEGAKRRLTADMEEYDRARLDWERTVADWEESEEQGKKPKPPRKPRRDAYDNPAEKRQPGGMFNGMIAPLAKLSVRGFLFYQGENNSFTEAWKPFPKTFPAVISDWRSAFDDPSLPLGIIQIAGWSNRRSMTYDMNHHTNIVREIQFLTWQRTPNTGLIVTYDTNSNGSIHPARKLPVGERSARWALAEVYGVKSRKSDEPLEWHGPVWQSLEVTDSRIVLSFEPKGRRGLRLDQDDDAGFYIAGDDRVFHPGRARVISGERVEVWSPEVPRPVAVRYAFSNLPLGGLMNRREIPAYPFRTDRWPLTPHQSTGEYQVD